MRAGCVRVEAFYLSCVAVSKEPLTTLVTVPVVAICVSAILDRRVNLTFGGKTAAAVMQSGGTQPSTNSLGLCSVDLPISRPSVP